jgi:hypothetical protein
MVSIILYTRPRYAPHSGAPRSTGRLHKRNLKKGTAAPECSLGWGWLHDSQERMTVDILQREIDKMSIGVNAHGMGVWN